MGLNRIRELNASRYTARRIDSQEEVWRGYSRTKSIGDRNRLIELYHFLVTYNAEMIHRRLPDEIDIDDLVGAGVFGLIDAIGAFDIGRGVRFETYAAPRIRGAILDEFRVMDWVPRLVRSRSVKYGEVRMELEMELGMSAEREEVETRIASLDGLDNAAKIVRDGASVISIRNIFHPSRKMDGNNSDRFLLDYEAAVGADIRDSSVDNLVNRGLLKEFITRRLSRDERLILILRYYEGMTFREVGASMGLSDFRIRQIHSNLSERLRMVGSRLETELETPQ